MRQITRRRLKAEPFALNFFFIITLIFINGCSEVHQAPNLANKGLSAMTQSSLIPFGSNKNFEHYIAALKKERQAKSSNYAKSGDTLSMPVATSVPVAETDSAGNASDNITNNQEIGVDEGGIVKKMGDYLIVLRRGRLFSLELNSLAPIDNINTFPEGSKDKGTWYDEILTHENKIIVIGYSYAISATEVGVFELSDKGELSHEQTFYLRSNDYYSSRNSASRLVNGKLIFYMPYSFIKYNYNGEFDIQLPAQAIRNRVGDINDWEEIIDESNIFMPIQETHYPVMHSVISCDLEKLDSSSKLCSAQSIIGPSSREFYVSPNAVYLWVSQGYGNKDNSKAYRMALDNSNPGFIDVEGQPIDQFSFKERDGYLNVLLRSQESNPNSLSLMKVDINKFDKSKVSFVPWEHKYKKLNSPKGYALQNRFVGDHILYGSSQDSFYFFEIGPETGLASKRAINQKLYFYDYVNFSEKLLEPIQISHDVERIDIMGNNAIVIGKNGQDLLFSSVDLDNFSKPKVLDVFLYQGASQGESRSHGFFFKPNIDDKNSGLLGLPTRISQKYDSRSDSLFQESAEVLYLQVNNGQFSQLGSLESQASPKQNDNCIVSCADWYGNSRPIFIGDRILALLGYELVEGIIDNSNQKLLEKDRVSFLPN